MDSTRRTVSPAATERRRTAGGRAVLAAVVGHVVGFAGAGCTAPRPPLVVTNPDPSVKIPAYKKAVRAKDRAAVRQFVKDLDSDDPAVRLYAIDALRRMTGNTFGYRYYQSDEQRRPAVDKWNEWLAAREAAHDAPREGPRGQVTENADQRP